MLTLTSLTSSRLCNNHLLLASTIRVPAKATRWVQMNVTSICRLCLSLIFWECITHPHTCKQTAICLWRCEKKYNTDLHHKHTLFKLILLWQRCLRGEWMNVCTVIEKEESVAIEASSGIKLAHDRKSGVILTFKTTGTNHAKHKPSNRGVKVSSGPNPNGNSYVLSSLEQMQVVTSPVFPHYHFLFQTVCQLLAFPWLSLRRTALSI